MTGKVLSQLADARGDITFAIDDLHERAGYQAAATPDDRGCCTPAAVTATRHARTVLTGPLDRSALYGVLTEVEALGLDLLEVRQLTPDCKSPGSGDNRSP